MSSLSYQITTIHRCARAFRAKRLSETDLLPPHIHYILIICANPGAAQEALVHHLYTGKSSVTRHLSKLEKLGYIRRVSSESDKRSFLVYPTEKALAILPLCQQIERDWNACLMKGFHSSEAAMLENLMQQLCEHAHRGVHSEENPEKAI